MTAIVLAILFGIAAIGRLVIAGTGHNAVAWVARMQNDPGSKVSTATLPDGTHRTTIDTSDGAHIVVDDRGWNGKHIEILDRSDHGHEHSSVVSGSIHVETLPSHGGSMTVIDTNGETPFLAYAMVGALVALIVATILGAPFARENDGHLEYALTRPASRVELALRTIGADVAGIVAALLLGIIFAIATQALFELPRISFSATDALSLGLGVAAPLAMYAFIAAATASMKRGAGMVIGFVWPVLLIVTALSHVPAGENALYTTVHWVFWTLALIDPVSYMHMQASAPVKVNGAPIVQVSAANELAVLALLSVAYLTAAVAQWRRIEA